MKPKEIVTLLFVILFAATAANLIALWVAARQVQAQINGTKSNATIGAVIGLLGGAKQS